MEPTMKQKVEELVKKITAMTVVTPERAAMLDTYANASDEDMPKVYENLQQLSAELEQIEAEVLTEEQQLLDEYLLQLKEITTKAQKLSLEFSEAVDREKDDATEVNLLQQLDQQ